VLAAVVSQRVVVKLSYVDMAPWILNARRTTFKVNRILVTLCYGVVDWRLAKGRHVSKRLLGKSLETPDEVASFDRGEVRKVNLDGFRVAVRVLQPGWRWSEHVKPRSGTESCQVLHRGYVVSGRTRVVMNDGSEMEIGPGDAYVIPPGHDNWVVGDEPFVGVDVTLED
jgi:mannose-6-phosphate isomerase-like protein (cupin superfamily)